MIDACPNCGSHVLYEVDLDYSGMNGFRPDAYGTVPEIGDTIASCGDCGTFVVLDDNGDAVEPTGAVQSGAQGETDAEPPAAENGQEAPAGGLTAVPAPESAEPEPVPTLNE